MLFASASVRRAPNQKHYLAFVLLIPISTIAAQLALFALIYRLVASHQHLNGITGILRVGVGVLAEAAYPFERRVVSNVIDKILANEEP